MSRGVDLHLHSTCSDGVLAPTALVELLAASAIGVFALTDHDTVAGQAEAQAAAARHGLTCLTGIELSARWLGRTVHIVALGIDPSGDRGLDAGCRRVDAERHDVHGAPEPARREFDAGEAGEAVARRRGMGLGLARDRVVVGQREDADRRGREQFDERGRREHAIRARRVQVQVDAATHATRSPTSVGPRPTISTSWPRSMTKPWRRLAPSSL